MEVLLTVAVKVTDWPKVEGLADELTAVLVDAGLTFWLPVSAPLLLLKFPSALT